MNRAAGEHAAPVDWLIQFRDCVPPSSRWAIADEWLIEGLRRGEAVVRGRQGQRVYGALRIAQQLGLLRLAAAAISAGQLARILASRPRRVAHHTRSGVVRVLVGFGARAEEHLSAHYRARHSSRVAVVDETQLSQAATIQPGGRAVWRAWGQAVRSLSDALAIHAHHERRADLAAAASKRLAEYAYARAWWRLMRTHYQVEEACFLAAGPCAFAAVDEGVPARYLQHGLIGRSVLIPAFNWIEPLTRDEERHFQRLAPGAGIDKPRYSARAAIAGPSRLALLASGNRANEEMALALPLIRHLAGVGISTRIRLFHGEAPDRYWGRIDSPPFEVAPSNGPFDAELDRARPSLVVSWGSTALAEALHHGIIPITLAWPTDRLVEETVYPLFERCLRWPADRDAIDSALGSPAVYASILGRLRESGA